MCSGAPTRAEHKTCPLEVCMLHHTCTPHPQDRQSVPLFSINFVMSHLHVYTCSCKYLLQNLTSSHYNWQKRRDKLLHHAQYFFPTSVMKNLTHTMHGIKLCKITYCILHYTQLCIYNQYLKCWRMWILLLLFGNDYWETNVSRYAKFEVVTKYINIWCGSWETGIVEQEHVAVARKRPVENVRVFGALG